MISNFSACWAFSAQQEGSYTGNQSDPVNWTGGACGVGICASTKYGISAAAYPQLDIANLTQPQAGIIMKADYWDKASGDDLPAGIDLVVFDFAITAGPGASAMELQGLLRVEQDEAAALTLSHQAYYRRRLPTFGEFGIARDGTVPGGGRADGAFGSGGIEPAYFRYCERPGSNPGLFFVSGKPSWWILPSVQTVITRFSKRPFNAFWIGISMYGWLKKPSPQCDHSPYSH